MQSRILGVLLGACFLAVASTNASAVMPENEGFRVDNAVYAGKERDPIVRTTTIFLNGAVYDFMERPQEAIVLDAESGRFTLLNMVRRIRAELSIDEVTRFVQALRDRALSHENPFAQFMAAPLFDEQVDASSQTLTLDSAWVTYKVEFAKPDDAAVVEGYRGFADLYCQVNTMLNPRQSPPFARMRLNAALAEYDAIPAEIHLTLRPKRTFPPTRVSFRSTHDLVRSVGQPDLDRVAQTREFMSIFKLVSFEEYRREELR